MNIDKNFALNNNLNENLKWINPLKTKEITIYGFPFIQRDQAYLRLSKSFITTNQTKLPNLCFLGTNTSGGQIHFKTTAKKITLACKLNGAIVLANMSATAQGGFDLYVGSDYDDLLFYDSSRFVVTKTEYTYEFDLRSNGEEKLVMLNFPLYLGVLNLELGLDKDSSISPAGFKRQQRIVIYGTSITQGGCASRPGLSYSNLLSRRFQREFINFGFSGNAFGEKEIANEVARIENVEMFILDYEANAGTNGLLEKTLAEFIKIIRCNNPSSKIVVLSRIKYLFDDLNLTLGKRRAEIRAFQENLVKKLRETDEDIYYIDGSKMLGEHYHEFTVDSIHPNDLGFMKIADYLENNLRKILK